MTGPYITDMRHFMDERGEIPDDLPAVPRYIGAIVAAASTLPIGRIFPLELRCRRRPGHQSCPGSIHSRIDPETDHIFWFCPCCDDHGFAYNWPGSPWDRRSTDPDQAPPSTDGPAGFSPKATEAWNAVAPRVRLQLLNNFWCGVCRTTASVDLRGGSVAGGDLILRGHCTRCGNEIARVVEEVAGKR